MYKCEVCEDEFKEKYFCKEQNKCILHCEKKHVSTFILFNEKLKEYFQKELEFPFINLENIYFPKEYDFFHISDLLNKDIDKEICFSDCVFKNIKFHNESEVKNKLGNIKFFNCKFDEIKFEGIEFYKLVFKYNNWEKSYNIENMIFKRCEFENDFILKPNQEEQRCITNMDFSYSKFNKSFELYNISILSKLTLDSTEFYDSATFIKSRFDKISLENSTFEKNVLFNNAIFNTELNLENTFFKGEANFLNIKAKNIANRETARIIKHSFEKLDNIIEANKFYALEMEKREEELRDKNRDDYSLTERMIFTFHKFSSNHSQEWLLVLLWMFNLTLVFSAFKQEICFDDQWPYIFSFLSIGLLITFIECFALLEIKEKYKFWFFIGFGFINYISYGVLTCDFSLICASNTFNPFSIMTGKETLTFGILMYKVAIAYLIYQFIISIRQNTRRK